MESMDIRKKIQEAGLKQWQGAKMVGCGEATLVRWLRDDPIPEERQKRIIQAIETAKKKKGA